MLQQTGVLLKHTKQQHPADWHVLRQLQNAWSISQQCLSPLVQVMQQPSLV
jgi:hypothetical protein